MTKSSRISRSSLFSSCFKSMFALGLLAFWGIEAAAQSELDAVGSVTSGSAGLISTLMGIVVVMLIAGASMMTPKRTHRD